MAVGQKKLEAQWTADERKAANLRSQRLKSLIMSKHQFLHIDHLFNQNFSFHLKTNPNRGKPRTLKLNTTKSKPKLALLSSSASTLSSSSSKNKGLIAETYDWDDEEVSSDENEVTEVKALMALTDEERVSRLEDNDDRESFLDYMCIDLNYVEEQRNNLLSKYRNLVQELNTCKEQLLVLKQAKLDLLTMQHVPSNESQRNTTDHSIFDSSVTDYDLVDESLVCSTIAPTSSTQEADCAKELFKVNLPQDLDLQGLQYLFLPAYIVDIMIIIIMIVYTIPLVKICGSCDHDTHGHNKIISLRRGINPRNPQHVTKNYETCDSNVHTTSYHNDIKWLRKRETLQAKNAESFKVSKNESSSALRSKTPTKR
ncbi:hypothetical protein Tco_0984628 [Tanacetum coccineum]